MHCTSGSGRRQAIYRPFGLGRRFFVGPVVADSDTSSSDWPLPLLSNVACYIRCMPKYVLPSFSHEAALHEHGLALVAGVDEAGAGCWAGPVYAAAVVLTEPLPSPLVRDSKTLSAKQREAAAGLIKERAHSWAVGTASAAEIDELNIRQAAGLAMRRAVAALSSLPDFVLVDWFEIKGLTVPQQGVKGGDRVSQTIAAASVIAKTERDRLMRELCQLYPNYGFSAHKGYGTQIHQAALREHGPCAEHRMSYQPVAACRKQPA